MFGLFYYFNINSRKIGSLNVDLLFGFWNILQYNMSRTRKKYR